MAKRTYRTKAQAAELREKALEYLALINFGELGQKILIERGYSSFTKKEFIKKHSLGHDYFLKIQKREDFADKYFDLVKGKNIEKLPLAFQLLLRKHPDKWIQLMFENKARDILANKNINLNTTPDDKDFLDKFFGVTTDE